MVRVKGKADQIAVCTLRDENREREPEHHWDTLFLGREAELVRFRQVWREAAAGRGGTLFVAGEPGVGKTRFFDEALRRMGLESRSVRTFCEEHLHGIPFAPWVELLRSIMGLDGTESIEEATAVVARALEDWAGDMRELGSLLNPLLGVDLPPGEVVSSLSTQDRRERLVELMVRMAVSSCPHGGGILLIEDIDWADDSSMEAITRLAQEIHDERFLLLLSARSSDPSAELPESATTMVLPELSRAESVDLIRRSLGESDLPEAVAEALHAKTRGNPLFLEEVIHSLGAPGVLGRILQASSVSQAAELATLAIPDRVQGLLMSRLDSIPIPERELLKVASVVGREFEKGILDGLDGLRVEPGSLDGLLESLRHSAIIIPAAETGAFRFRHALMQEVAYESLPYAQRRDIHAEIAGYLGSSSMRPDHGLLVHHYTRAGDDDHARVHAVRAAESSQSVYAFREAIDYLRIAVRTAPSTTSEHACLRSCFEESIGDCLESIARHNEAVLAYQSARRRWRSPGVRAIASAMPTDVAHIPDPDARESDLCRKIAVCVEHQHVDYKRALLWLRKAELLLPPNRTALAARLEVGRENILFRLGRLAEALVHGERGLALARADGDKALQAYALAMLNNPLVGQGMLSQAIDVSREAVTLYEESGDLAGQAMSHGNLAMCYQLIGDFRSSLTSHEVALRLNERLGYITGASIEHNNIAEVLLQLGRTEEAIDHLRHVVDNWEERKMPPVLVGFSLVNLSKGLLRQGESREAAHALEEGRRLLAQAGARGLLIEADIQAAQLALDDGRLEEAQTACLEAIEAAQKAGAKLNEAQALHTLGRVRLACKDLVEAEEHLHSSVRLAEEVGADYDKGLALLAVSELYALHDPTEEGRHVAPLAEAIALFEGMGADHDLCKAVELRDACSPDPSPRAGS
jgi:tetratricopeptide (TPR) repeat protein